MFGEFDFQIIITSIPFLIEGMWLTLELSVITMVCATVSITAELGRVPYAGQPSIVGGQM